MLLARALIAVALVSVVSAVIVVPPPTNVTVICQNLKTIASWNYNKQQLETSFTVNIKGCKRDFMDETTDHLYDLGPFLKECYMDYLYVTVTAIQGENRSEAVRSNSFSFNYLKMVDTTCELEFPPVTVAVNVDEKRALVKFQNPFYFYKELEHINIQDDVLQLRFTVISFRDVQFDAFCTVKQTICKLDIEAFPEGVEKCVKLKGVLFVGKGVKQVQFRETDQICSHESSEKNTFLLAVILLGAFALLVIAAVIVIFEVKAWTMRTPVLPNILDPRHWEQDNKDPVSDAYQSLTAMTSKPDPDLNPPAQPTLISDDQQPETLDSTSETESSAECVFTDEDEDEESVSPYESRQFTTIDMGDDMVTGYSGK
ncbi:interferon gamma receptor 1-like isoform X2 [Melanotaenia boesemani]|uniref:interferon gamma receptor 1-like isoform X2 n=1 Tax=Melanotaenia boesemani TaxID=1250792 RepID=UPI001C056255|nr:interferon gamma receptor 1-like isoform X2 [Melanotaenia boesemani]